MRELFQKFTGFFKPNFIFQHEGAAEKATEAMTPEQLRGQEVERIEAETKQRLEDLKMEIKSSPMDSVNEITEYSEFVEKKDEIINKFEQYIEGLNKKYLQMEHQIKLMKEVVSRGGGELAEDNLEDFEGLAKTYQENRIDQMSDYLELVFANSERTKDAEALKKGLTKLADALDKEYRENSRGDGRIDLADLQDMSEVNTAEQQDLLFYLTSGQHEKAVDTLEELGIMDPESMEKIINISVNLLIDESQKNGTSEQLLSAAQGSTWGKGIEDFDDLREKMQKYAKTGGAGVKESMKIITKLGKVVHKNFEDLYEGVPDLLKSYVIQERSKILTQQILPTNIDDKAVVGFMRQTTLQGRMRILNSSTDRKALFQAIANIAALYPKQYYKGMKKPKKRIDVLKNSTKYHEVARKMALVSFAKESLQIVKNLDEKRGKEASTYGVERNPPPVNFKFKSRYRTVSHRYVSKAIRDGFNGAELGKAGLTAWALFTVISNVLASKGDPEKILKNPFILGSGGILYALHNPIVYKTLGKPPEVAAEMWAHDGLNKLGKTYYPDRIKKFAKNPSEFDAMEELKASRIKSLMKKAENASKESKKSPKPKPKITAKMIQNALSEKNPRAVIAGDKNAELRYDFYRKIYSKKINIRSLRTHCTSWANK